MKILPNEFSITDGLLKGKVILVTGAGDGIGKIAAITYARLGASVILSGKTIPKLESVYDQIEAEGSGEAAIYPINFEGASEHDYVEMAAKIYSEYGRLDGLLLNAATLGEKTPIANYDSETWFKVMQVNLNAPFLLLKNLLPVLEKSTSAAVITTTSTVAFTGRAYWGAYGVSKAALVNLTELLAQEWEGAVPVRINSINPGATRTAMRAKAYPAEDPAQLASPEDHMPLYVYLISDKSAGENGEHFTAKA
jgi:NAD(P)-dependent dehydrogenase (short-subunit alcohol dehydrogenase family)